GHGSHTAWRLRKYKTILKLLPSILEKSNAQIIGTIMVIIVAVAGSIGFGVVLDGYGLNHPINLVERCPVPLILNANGCFQQITSTVLNNGKNTTVVTLVPVAGQIVSTNGSGR